MVMNDVVCPSCRLDMEYWTKSNFINCTKCNKSITVEPSTEEEIKEDFEE